MSATENLERRITDHYAAEATPRAPDWVLERTLAAVDATPQRRAIPGLPWRIPLMPSLGRLTLAAVAVVAIAFVGSTLLRGPVVGPASSPSPEPTSPRSVPPLPPLTGRFDSALNGISMAVPAGWQKRPATDRWTDGVISFDAVGVDVIFDSTRGQDLYLALASAPLDGKPDHVWREALTLPDCPGGHGGGVLTFDGATGWVTSCGGTPVGTHSALLATETRGYAIVLYLGDEALVETYTDEWFLAMLETLDLRADGTR